jgi:hypothetical protein
MIQVSIKRLGLVGDLCGDHGAKATAVCRRLLIVPSCLQSSCYPNGRPPSALEDRHLLVPASAACSSICPPAGSVTGSLRPTHDIVFYVLLTDGGVARQLNWMMRPGDRVLRGQAQDRNPHLGRLAGGIHEELTWLMESAGKRKRSGDALAI